MAALWAISPVIGTGTEGPEADPFRAAIMDRSAVSGQRIEAVIPTDAAGQPTANWALCALDVDDPTGIPDLIADHDDLDQPVSRLSAAKRQRLQTIADRFSEGTTLTPRQLVRRIGRRLDANFSERQHLGEGAAPPVGSFVSDTFTDTEGTLLTAHTGETGATWSGGTIPSNGIAPEIASNRLRGQNSNSSFGYYFASGLPASADYDVAATFVVVSDLDLGIYTAITGRQATDAKTCYRTGYDDGSSLWRLHKVVAGTATQLGTWAEALVATDQRAVVLELRDATKKLYVAGVERISSTDNDITAAGRAGVAINSIAGITDTTGLHLDNFTATDGAPAGPITVDPLSVQADLLKAPEELVLQADAAAPTRFERGFLRDANGMLVVLDEADSTTPVMARGLIREGQHGPLVVNTAGGTMRRGFIRTNASDALVVTDLP